MKSYIVVFLLFNVVSISSWASSNSKTFCSNPDLKDNVVKLSPEWKKQISDSFSRNISPAKAFSEAIAFRKRSYSFEEKVLSEYWISRTLLDGGMLHVAYSGFSSIASNLPNKKTLTVQIAALQCVNELQSEYSSLRIPESLQYNFFNYSKLELNRSQKEVIWTFAEHLFRNQLNSNVSNNEIFKTVTLLSESETRDLFKGLFLLKNNKHLESIAKLEKHLLLSGSTSSTYSTTEVKLLLARAYYGSGQYNKASNTLKSISKSSNELATALSELAWSDLMSEQYSESIGVGFSLQTGGLRLTFEPEAPMVMAMSFNELCQFPESLKAIQVFRKNYESSYKWLKSWNDNKSNFNLYKSSLEYLKKNKLDIPLRITSEWARSPSFISNQSEINLILDEDKSSDLFSKKASKEEIKYFLEIKTIAKSLKNRIKEERQEKKISLASYSNELKYSLKDLNNKVIHYKRFHAGASYWHKIISSNNLKSVNLKHKLVGEINMNLASKNERMLNQLQEIAENNQLIEIEIFNGASQDVIWQNAHPDYKDVVKNLNQDSSNMKTEKVWNWGKASYSISDESSNSSEVWEDELGSFKAELFDNCTNKDKYTEVKIKEQRKK